MMTFCLFQLYNSVKLYKKLLENAYKKQKQYDTIIFVTGGAIRQRGRAI